MTTTEVETMSEETISSNRINKGEIENNFNKNINEIKEISNEEALEIQINYVKSSPKNILFSIIQNEYDENLKEKDLYKNNIDEGINLYLQNIYNKYYCNEMKYILNSINNKISYIIDKNKEYIQNKKFIERETNTVSQEKIDYFNEKENLDKELELLQLKAKQNSLIENTAISLDSKLKRMSEHNGEDIDIIEKKKKLENLKKKYNKIFEEISANKKEFSIIKNKKNMIQGENMILNEKLKQKQIIWEQLRKENEKVKKLVFKKDYSNVEKENINNIKKDEKEKKDDNKNIKVSKIGSFLKGFMGNNK